MSMSLLLRISTQRGEFPRMLSPHLIQKSLRIIRQFHPPLNKPITRPITLHSIRQRPVRYLSSEQRFQNMHQKDSSFPSHFGILINAEMKKK